ncbi:uncharacterized protein [Procambarus clarkii]|uniref:uncharacterized protein n=1 Tax=Procambarus clarkii TaxID=6728 RepID=UPI00374451E6
MEKLTKLFQSMWNEGELPQQLKDANIVHIYKKKGNRQSCYNHQDISLHSIAGKILARILLNRFATFIDLTKAFDTVSKVGLWKVMENFACPSKFTEIARQFHDVEGTGRGG